MTIPTPLRRPGKASVFVLMLVAGADAVRSQVGETGSRADRSHPARQTDRVDRGAKGVASDGAWPQVSGIYPHLAVFNDTGTVQDRECGIGAVVPWAGKLWLITYPPHRRTGSPDKLYEVDSQLKMTVRPESVGGTHAGRMIHRESQQLILGPYVIDASGGVRAFDQSRGFPARITAVARHLTDPANKVYIFDMEGPIWEADVRTLAVSRLFVKPVPGWHGKGAYTGQGRLIIANNGESRAADLTISPGKLQSRRGRAGPRTSGPSQNGMAAPGPSSAGGRTPKSPDPAAFSRWRHLMRRCGARAGTNARCCSTCGRMAGGTGIDSPKGATPSIPHMAGTPSGRGFAASATGRCC